MNIQLQQIAEDLTIKYFGNKLAIGRYFIYRKDGVAIPIKILSGYFLDPIYNRLSNFWHWRRVKPNGRLGEKGCGYGGNEPIFTCVSRKEAIEYAKNKPRKKEKR